jgi:CDP-glucose 4,6-dehydratase
MMKPAHPISNLSFWKKRTVLIGGATGFLGGWLVRRLLELDANVIAIVRTVKPKSQFYLENFDQRVQVAHGCVADIEFIEKIFKTNPEISVFFHAAYGGDVNQVLAQPLECFRSTALSTWAILDLCQRKYPKCISVISSSDKAYGSQTLPYRESNPLCPQHPYEVAKACQDHCAQTYGKVYGLPTAVTRCGNYFGGFDFNFTRLIPGVLKDLANGQIPVLRSNGRFTRDFLYIEDAVNIQLMLAERLEQDPTIYGEAFNFSYGLQVEVIEIVRRLAELTGELIEPIVNESVRVEIPHMHLSSEKASEMLNWKPGYTFDEGLQRSVKWYSNYFKENIEEATLNGKPTGLPRTPRPARLNRRVVESM